ncbi:MAG: hypothetical protein ABUL62_27235 [Myxococcales bacterium]
MRPRRTAIVPRVLFGTAVVGLVPLEVGACGGTAESDGGGSNHAGATGVPAGAGGGTNHAGASGSTSHAGAPQGGGYIVLGGAFNGGSGASGNGGHAGTEVAMAGEGGADDGGAAGESANGGSAGFIVLAINAFGGGASK